MKESCFQAEFQDVFIELPRTALKSFIHKLLQAQFRISWRHEEDTIELVIKSKEGEVTIPITHPNEHSTVIQLHELSIFIEDLAILLEELITEAKGRAIVKTESRGWIYVSCFEKGKIVSVMKIGGGEKANMGSYRTIKKRSPTELVDPAVRKYVISAEIDYFLMELVEAMNEKNSLKIEDMKQKLSKLVKEKNNIEGH